MFGHFLRATGTLESSCQVFEMCLTSQRMNKALNSQICAIYFGVLFDELMFF